MYLDGTKFNNLNAALASFDDGTTQHEVSGEVSFESYAGSGDVQIDIKAGGRSLELILDTEDALALADLIRTYAEAGARHKERKRRTMLDDRGVAAAVKDLALAQPTGDAEF